MPIDWGGIIVEGAVKDSAGNDVIAARYRFHDADLLVTLCDPFALLPSRDVLAAMKVAMWFPVDCDPLGEADVTVLRESGAVPIAISRFGERVLRAEGADPLYVPHSVDTSLFTPGDPVGYRDGAGIGPGTFVIGINAMNRDTIRKGWHEQMLAFARFHHEHPDSVLSLHTAATGTPGINLAGMAARLGITEAVRFPDDYAYASCLISQEQMAAWYRGLDLLSLCSYGEGFGIPLLEAQACGIPVACTDWSAMTELCGAGWLVAGTPYWAPGHGAWWKRPDTDDIVNAYESAWQARENGEIPALTAAARAFAECYDADLVLKQFWVPALAEIAERIGC